MALKQIKNKIRSVGKTHKVTKAMEAVSAVKMRRSQERARVGRPYATTALSILERVSGAHEITGHPLMEQQEVKRVCLVVITSDKGLAGSLNSAVLKAAHQFITDSQLALKDVSIVAIGKKAREYFEKRGVTILDSHENVSDDVALTDTQAITKRITSVFANREADEVVVTYTNFRSTFEQRAATRTLLPITTESIARIVRDILPTTGRFSERAVDVERHVETYTIEPSPEQVLDELLPFLVNIAMYHVLLESKASEHSARMVAMKNASDRAHDMGRELNRAFNKERQSEITREMSEITGGMETLS